MDNCNIRRENGLTTRFIAQGIINDLVFRKQEAINYLFKKVGIISKNWQYFFFFHLQDFEIPDKSELDIILWNDEFIIPIEVKGFTDANSPDVKREIIRNCLHVECLREKPNFFNKNARIIPILIYSHSYHLWKHKGNSYNYFTDEYLIKTGKNHKNYLENFERGNYPITEIYLRDKNKLHLKKKEYSKLIKFITWDDILETYQEFNKNGLFDNIIEGLIKVQDVIQDTNGIYLVSSKRKTF